MRDKFTRRSFLCIPATAVECFTEANTSCADVGMVDLEDGVSPRRKAEARKSADEYLKLGDKFDQRTTRAIRLNSSAEPDGLLDLAALNAYSVKPDIVVIPKVQAARDVDIVASAIDRSSYLPELYAVIESSQAVQRVAQIALRPRLSGLIFGASDYAKGQRCTMQWGALISARTAILEAASPTGSSQPIRPFTISTTLTVSEPSRKGAERWAFVDELQFTQTTSQL